MAREERRVYGGSAITAIVPVVVVYIAGQRQFIAGIASGAVKD